MYKSSMDGTLCVCVCVILSVSMFTVSHYTKKGGNFFFSIALGAADRIWLLWILPRLLLPCTDIFLN